VFEYLHILQCPACGASANFVCAMDGRDGHEPSGLNGSLTCKTCGQEYSIKNGVIDFLRENHLSSMDRAWQKKLLLHEKWWREERPTAARAGAAANRWMASRRLIENYFNLDAVDTGSHGLLLDVGCGDGRRRGNFFRKKYLGIDPLLLCNSYPFPFIRGVAEQLPFAGDSFDVVTAVESIDHFADPARSVQEMTRCLAPGGVLFVFAVDGSAHGPAYSRRQARYSVSEDEVHMRDYSVEDLTRLLEGRFEKLDVDKEDGYVAAWGWKKIRSR